LAKRRRLVHRPWFTAAAGGLAAAYLRTVDTTGRWDEAFDDDLLAHLAADRPIIGVFWHQRILAVPPLWRRLRRRTGFGGRAVAIVSTHGDGELVARTLAPFDIAALRGATRRGGARAARTARAAVAEGASLAVVVDGPRGPHGHVHAGAIYLARATGAPLVPVTFAVARGVRASSWDRLLVPLPFTRGRYHAGAPLWVAADADEPALEAARLDLAARLHDFNAAADEAFGRRR
jgi:lysophospholipid acyltransferase (LPLAT)-like uncharacterized protein